MTVHKFLKTALITAMFFSSIVLVQPARSAPGKWIPPLRNESAPPSKSLKLAKWKIKDGPESSPAVAVSPKYPGLEITLPSHEPQFTWFEDWRDCPNNKDLKLLVWGARTGKKGEKYVQQFVSVIDPDKKKLLGHFIVRAYWVGKDNPQGDQFSTPLLFLSDGRIKVRDEDLFYDDFDKMTYAKELKTIR